MRNTPSIVLMFKTLGDPTRLQIFDFLRNCCSEVAVDESGSVRTVVGPTVGEVCCHITGIDKITSRISFHLKELRNAGLIHMDRRGKNMICRVDDDALVLLREYLDLQTQQNTVGDGILAR